MQETHPMTLPIVKPLGESSNRSNGKESNKSIEKVKTEIKKWTKKGSEWLSRLKGEVDEKPEIVIQAIAESPKLQDGLRTDDVGVLENNVNTNALTELFVKNENDKSGVLYTNENIKNERLKNHNGATEELLKTIESLGVSHFEISIHDDSENGGETSVIRHSYNDELEVGYVIKTKGIKPNYRGSVPVFSTDDVYFINKKDGQVSSYREMFKIDKEHEIHLAAKSDKFRPTSNQRNLDICFVTDEKNLLTSAHEAGHTLTEIDMLGEGDKKIRVIAEQANVLLTQDKSPLFGKFTQLSDLKPFLTYAIVQEQLATIAGNQRIKEVTDLGIPLLNGNVGEKLQMEFNDMMGNYQTFMLKICQKLGVDFQEPQFGNVEEGKALLKALAKECEGKMN